MTSSHPQGQPARGLIMNIMRYCVHDGPGIRTLIFLKGCPLRCSWCHNPEGQALKKELSFREDRCIKCGDCFALCPNDAVVREGDRYVASRDLCDCCGKCEDRCVANAREIIGKEMSVEELVAEVRKDVAFFAQSGGGATFSGGEPMMQADFLRSSLRALKADGIHTAVETTAHCAREPLDAVAEYTDLFLIDLKLMDSDAHRNFTGSGNERILENIVRLSDTGRDVLIRMPLIGGVNDHLSNLQAMTDFLRSRTRFRTIHLLPYHRVGVEKLLHLGIKDRRPEFAAPFESAIMDVERYFETNGFSVTIGG